MFQLGKILVSEEIIEKDFVCNLSACKGLGEYGEWETPLIGGNECAYTVFDGKGVAKCALEEAYNKGVTTWKKPISCHLYPIRVTEYTSLTAVNYHKWQLCDPACELGDKLQVPVYRFVREALIRKFGEQWFEELEEVARQHRTSD